MTGPFFEDLVPGRSFTSDGMTVTDGHSAWFQSFSGDRNPLHLDDRLARAAGLARAPLSTALLAHIVIGHSTVATHEVVANLFYSNVAFPRPVLPGVTLTTTTTVVARAEATARADRPPRGKVLLEIVAVDDDGSPVVEMTRTALVRKASRDDTGAADDIEPAPRADADVVAATGLWRDLFAAIPSRGDDWRATAVGPDDLADPVTGALELVRVTGNLAKAHRDVAFGQDGRRLVYGGHTISLAQAALSRSIGAPHAVVGWQRCSHPAPVFEEDLLRSEVTGVEPVGAGLDRVQLVTTSADADVQHWSPIVAS